MVAKLFQRLNQIWRIIATGFCFAVFGVGGVVLTLLVLPLQRVLEPCKHKQKQKARITYIIVLNFLLL